MSKTAEVQIDDQERIELAEQRKEAEEAAADLFEWWHRFTGEGACVPPRYDPDMVSEQGKAACFMVAMLGPKLDAIQSVLVEIRDGVPERKETMSRYSDLDADIRALGTTPQEVLDDADRSPPPCGHRHRVVRMGSQGSRGPIVVACCEITCPGYRIERYYTPPVSPPGTTDGVPEVPQCVTTGTCHIRDVPLAGHPGRGVKSL